MVSIEVAETAKIGDTNTVRTKPLEKHVKRDKKIRYLQDFCS